MDCMGNEASMSAMLPTIGSPGGPGIGSWSCSIMKTYRGSDIPGGKRRFKKMKPFQE